MESERERRHEMNRIRAAETAKEMIADPAYVFDALESLSMRELATTIARCMSNLDTAWREQVAGNGNAFATRGILDALHNLQRELLTVATERALGDLK